RPGLCPQRSGHHPGPVRFTRRTCPAACDQEPPAQAANSTAVSDPIAYRACRTVLMRADIATSPRGLDFSGTGPRGARRPRPAQPVTTTVTVISGCSEQVMWYVPGVFHRAVVQVSPVSDMCAPRGPIAGAPDSAVSRPFSPGPSTCSQRELLTKVRVPPTGRV